MSGPAITSLEDAARERVLAAEELDAAEREVEEFEGPYNDAVERRRKAADRLKRLDEGMEAVRRAHVTAAALADAGVEYEGPPLVVVNVYRGVLAFFLVAVGPKGTGLYLHTPRRSHRYQGKEHVVIAEQAKLHGVEEPRGGYSAMRDAGLWYWQARGSGNFGAGSGGFKPLGPPEGGRWKWLKVREQEALPEAVA